MDRCMTCTVCCFFLFSNIKLASFFLPSISYLPRPLPSYPPTLPASLVSKLALKVTDVLNLVQVEEGKEEPVEEGTVTLRNIADNGNYTSMQSPVLSVACMCDMLAIHDILRMHVQCFHLFLILISIGC